MNISKKLAVILDSVNFLHPFRDGNGRTQREFLRLLAGEKGWVFDMTVDIFFCQIYATKNIDN